jgi:hypothetical protein
VDKESIGEVGAFTISLATDLTWEVEYEGYLIAAFRYELEAEAVAFAGSLKESDIEERLRHNWESAQGGAGQ